ncbi:MAG TPA: hypothetical protein VFW65_20405 [Pseudonocardiaceae bacterium]|nr:hypothetical protein [Pseudonocardiaceae bacterium]
MGDWDDERGRHRSALGRVDWSCWLAAAGLLFVTVISVVVQFAVMGVITAILAVLLVVFDSWVNRPKGPRAARRDARGDTGWSDVRRTGSRQQQAIRQQPPNRRPQPDYRARQQQPRQQPQQRQPRPGFGQPQRGVTNQPGRQAQPPRPNRGQQQGGQPNRGVPNGQPTRTNQGQPQQRPPYRPAPPEPARGREPDYRART